MTACTDAGVLEPASTAEVRRIVADAHAAHSPLRIIGAGTWREAGAPCDATRTLSLRRVERRGRVRAR